MIPFEWGGLQAWIERSSDVLVKKLARNDCSWADSRKSHQNGVYIPLEIQRNGFFPELTNISRAKAHILEASIQTIWPASGEVKNSRLHHFTNKGAEFHFTRVPRESFSGLTPASLLVAGKLIEPTDGIWYWFVVIDADSTTAEQLESALDLQASFHFGVFRPEEVRAGALGDDEEELIRELEAALAHGTVDKFVAASALPAPAALAADAQQAWLHRNGMVKLDPWAIANPGDAVMSISRDIEYALYKRAETRLRAAEVVRMLLPAGGTLVSKVVHGFVGLDRLFLSASQTRKSRAGASFEHHVGRLLRDGRIRHEPQAIISARRPDFVLPGVALLRSHKRNFVDAMIVSLKTTLRERWKQVSMERLDCAIVLATVDDRVSAASIADMESNGIKLMVPESLKDAKEACYKGSRNVITFRQFFDDEIKTKRPSLRIS